MKIIQSQFWITPAHKKVLRKLARDRKTTQSQVVRDMLDANQVASAAIKSRAMHELYQTVETNLDLARHAETWDWVEAHDQEGTTSGEEVRQAEGAASA